MKITMPDLWDKILEADSTLVLRLGSKEDADWIRTSLSTYKTRLLREDLGIEELLGRLRLHYELAQQENSWLLSISLIKKQPRQVKAEVIECQTQK